MALEQCNVCGSLTSTNDEICLSCGYPAKGRPKLVFFKWTAIGVAVVFALFLVLGVINRVEVLLNSQPSTQIDR
ncbi:MAG: hypothetical protein F6K65_27665 [Moorea sp. SIO3C2]|nr:hypothetical protein [Moorena sp. SIO3C2]